MKRNFGENLPQVYRRLTLLLLVVMLTACAGQISTPTDLLTSWHDIEPKAKAAYIMSIYNAQYRDYERQVHRTNLTQVEVDVLDAKLKVLKLLWPAMSIYKTYVDQGATPPYDIDQELYMLIDQISYYVMEEVTDGN